MAMQGNHICPGIPRVIGAVLWGRARFTTGANETFAHSGSGSEGGGTASGTCSGCTYRRSRRRCWARVGRSHSSGATRCTTWACWAPTRCTRRAIVVRRQSNMSSSAGTCGSSSCLERCDPHVRSCPSAYQSRTPHLHPGARAEPDPRRTMLPRAGLSGLPLTV